MLLSALAFGACATTPPTTAPTALLGGDIDDVRARFGPPIRCSYGSGAWTLAYRDAYGTIIEDAVNVVDDVVIGFTPGLQRNRDRGVNRWTGARIEELVDHFGPGKVESISGVSATVSFGKRVYHVADGRVLGTSRQVTESAVTANNSR